MAVKQPANKVKAYKWKKGQSGNPKGRPPKDLSLTSLLKDELDKHPEINGKTDPRTWRQLLVQAWLRGAMTKPVLLQMLIERLEGRVAQPITGDNGGPIEVAVDAKGTLISAINRLAARAGQGADS